MTVQYQGVWSLQSAAQLQSTQRWVTDPLFENTTLLLQADDAANGAQNNTFLDSSSNSFAITRNGNTTQGSFTPFSLQPGAWSNFFDGSSTINYTQPALGNVYTIEFWTWPTAESNLFYVAGTSAPLIGYAGSPARLSAGRQGTWVITGSANPTLNAWNHIALVREGTGTNQFKLYLNGVLIGTGTEASTIASQSANIGGASGGSRVTAYISNLRIVNNTAVYTSNFTPPAAPLSSIPNTELLTCQSNRLIDANTQVAAKTFTFTGTPSVQPFAPFAPQFQWTPSVIGGSGYFDGTGDFLSVTQSLVISGQFSVECWFYRTTTDNNQRTLFAFNSTSTAYASIRLDTDEANTPGTIKLFLSTNGSAWGAQPSVTNAYAKYGWNHIVCTRDSSNGVRIIINGVLQSSSSFSGALYSGQSTHAIGCNNLPGTATNLFFGYIAELRLVNGSIPTNYQTSSTTVGTTIFTPPTAPITTSSQGATSSNVFLLTGFTNAGIYDGTMKNNLETVGNAQVSTAVVKYGSGSIFFNGSVTGLTTPALTSAYLFQSNSDWTIEFWFYTGTSTGTMGIFDTYFTNTSPFSGLIIQMINGTISVYDGASNRATTTTYANSTWHHFAWVNSAGTSRIYINGSNVTIGGVTSWTTPSNIFRTNAPIQIGRDYAPNYFTGYIDDLRVTKAARYTANFIPPSVALPRQ